MSNSYMKRLSALICAAVMLFTTLFTMPVITDAATSPSNKESDIVIVLDISGSMRNNDSDGLIKQALRMFANMMPAKGSRIGFVTFNTEATVLTTDKDGNPGFADMEDIADWDSLHKSFDEVAYTKDTAMGKGLEAARDLFINDARPDAKKAIIVFSDGADDLPKDPAGLPESDALVTEVKTWSKQNDCPIYVMSYPYQLSTDASEFAQKGGERNKSLAADTNGTYFEVNGPDDVEKSLDEITSQINQLNPQMMTVPPGYQETPLIVTPETVEVDIRITCSNPDVLTNARIELLDPNHNNVLADLSNLGANTRYDTEKSFSAATIKQIDPEVGEWTLITDNIDESIQVSFLSHYKLDLDAQMIPPASSPDQNTAYAGDQVTFTARMLKEDGTQVDDPDFYKSAEGNIVITARDNSVPEQTIKMDLNPTGDGFTAIFTVPKTQSQPVYDIVVTVNNTSLKKSTALELNTGNRPVELVKDDNGNELQIPDQKLNKGKSVEVTDIRSYAVDPEGDPISVTVSADSDSVEVTYDEATDTVKVEGKKWGGASVTVTYTDEAQNAVSKTFAVKVTDIVKTLLLSSVPIIIGILVLLFVIGNLFWWHKAIKGLIRVDKVVLPDGRVGMKEELKGVARGKKIFLRKIMEAYGTKASRENHIMQADRDSLHRFLNAGADKELTSLLGKMYFMGTPRGKKGVVFNVPKGLPVSVNGSPEGREVKQKLTSQGVIHIRIKLHDNRTCEIDIYYNKDAKSSGPNNMNRGTSADPKKGGGSQFGPKGGANPFASGGQGAGPMTGTGSSSQMGRPMGGQGAPMGGQSGNPFGGQGAPMGGQGGNPFGGQGAPMGGQGGNPFGGNGAGPMGGQGSAPMGGQGSNPFGGQGSAPTGGQGSNPFRH